MSWRRGRLTSTKENGSKERNRMKSGIRSQARDRRRSLLPLLVGATMLALFALAAPASQAAPADDFAFSETSASLSNSQAGRHADFETRFRFDGNPTEPLFGGNVPW